MTISNTKRSEPSTRAPKPYNKITFVTRHEEGLHCRFCHVTIPQILNETIGCLGIVCNSCKEHLKSYLDNRDKAVLVAKEWLYNKRIGSDKSQAILGCKKVIMFYEEDWDEAFRVEK